MNSNDSLYYNNQYNVNEYKTCAGLNCTNKPLSILKVKYINKTGHFCEQCTYDLIQSELAEKIQRGEKVNGY
jgi:hypothetical protein